MTAAKSIIHLFSPHESNNQKAKILHSSGLTIITLFLLLFQIVIGFTPKIFPRVLGYAAQISPSEVVRLTNDRRITAGLSPLTENGLLSQAAQAKGIDMLNKGYWAHFAPDGTSPWKFFDDFGYKYKYAGENLARDFGSPGSAVEAWMASPTHKENILSLKYREIGIGVVEGNLAGTETTIIVQFFGARAVSNVSIPIAKAQAVEEPSVVSGVVSPFATTKGVSLAVTGVLLLVLSIDLIAVRRRRIMRIGGRTFAHIAYFGMILAVILILKAGQVI